MKIYEIIMLFNYKKKKNLIKFLLFIKNLIIYNKGIILSIENWGKKKLCFKIKDNTKAIFLLLKFILDFNNYSIIIKYLKINNFFILRFFSKILIKNVYYLNNFFHKKILKRNVFKKKIEKQN